MRVGIVGAGHVGLVTAVTLAEIGHDVVATDQDEAKIDKLSAGDAWFYEPGLEDLLATHLASGRLRFTPEPGEAFDGAEVVFICVGTPARASGKPNLVAVEKAAGAIARFARSRLVVVEKSTVPAGTAERVKRILDHARPDLAADVHVVSNPEFLREGRALHDSLHPDRILVGTGSDWALDQMRRLYAPITERGAAFIVTDIPTAELSKHACNAFLALKISFINALARMCEAADADVDAVAAVMGADERIGPHFLRAGLGYGGSCFPKDIAAFHQLAEGLGYKFELLEEIKRINEEALEATLHKIEEAVWNLEDKRVVLLGLSFKPETDDIRHSPALTLARRLLDEGAEVVGFDPKAMSAAKTEEPKISVAPDLYEAVAGAHCLVLCTEWPEFADIDFGRVRELVAFPVLIDGRNFFDAERVIAAGFSYYPTGRPPTIQRSPR